MQPNEQDSNQSSPQSSGLNIPDYMRADVKPTGPNKSRGIIFVAVSVIILIIAGGLAGAVATWLQGEPERKLYQALDNMMQTSYVARDYDITAQDSETVSSIDAGSDFSEPAKPTSMASYVYSIPASEESSEVARLSGDMVVLGDGSVFARLQESPLSKPKLNQWYELSDSTIQTLDYSELVFMVNNPLDRLVIGNFDKDTRTKVIQFAKNNSIYLIKEHRGVELNGKTATMYTIETSRNAYISLNNKAAELAGIESPYVAPYSKNNKLQFRVWVDSSTSRVVQLAYDTKTDNGTAKTTIKYNYPGKINIEEPTGFEAN